MIEVYEQKETFDRYMVIIDNPDKDLDGHKPYYDVSIDVEGGLSHGSQWSQSEIDALHKRVATNYESTGASYAFKRIKAADMYPQAQRALLTELETEAD